MNKLFEIIAVFLCFNSVIPVLTFYIYDDNSNVGFIELEKSSGSYSPTYSNSKKQFTGSYAPRYQKYTSEHVVDSHFKIMKTPSRYTLPALLERNGGHRGSDYRMTDVPKVWQPNPPLPRNPVHPQQQQQLRKEQTSVAKTMNSVNAVNNKPGNLLPPRDSFTLKPMRIANQQQQQQQERDREVNKKVTSIPPIRPQAVNADYSSPLKRSHDEIFEPKTNLVQMNVRKTQISQDNQKIVRLNHNRHMASSAVHGAQNRVVPSAMLMDKTLHKSNGLNDHNMQLMARVMNDMHQLTDQRQNKGEYRKRDIKTTLDFYDKVKRNPISDNMRKYIGKDKTTVKERTDKKTPASNMEKARSHEDSLENRDAPYALFYRMNPENVDQQEPFVMMSSMESEGSNEDNEKRKSTSNDDSEMKKTTPKKQKNNTNALRLHKNMRNYVSSFRNQLSS